MRKTFSETFGHLYDPSDLEAYLSTAYSPDTIRATISNPRCRTRLVEDGGEAVAYAQVRPCSLPHPTASLAEAELQRIYVLKSHQSRGLGKQLIELALAWAGSPEAGFSGPMWVGVYSGNLKAQRFYASYGFTKVGEYDFPVGNAPPDREFILQRVSGPVVPQPDSSKLSTL